ncbi:MAG: ankyrin repeat domain-containing protein [Rhodobacterales bacterium]|nr:ankyrin repeat domain-containing protein [Rhodobacterales bacterium]
MTLAKPRQFAVVPPDDRDVATFDTQAGAEAAALAFGEGTHVVDTLSGAYHPAVQVVEGGELGYVGFGSFDARLGDDGNLIEAARKGEPAILRAFLARGADPNATDAKGGTVLHWAVAKGNARVVGLLLAAGADPARPDAQGTTPRDLAAKRGRDALVALLDGA